MAGFVLGERLLDLEQVEAALVELVGVYWLVGSAHQFDVGTRTSLAGPKGAKLFEHPFGMGAPVGDVARSSSPGVGYWPEAFRLAANGND
jgi:hypothetical protein